MDIRDFVQKLYKGCGKESDMVELVGLLDRLRDYYFYGEIEEQTLNTYVIRICKMIVAHMASCNKEYSEDQCQKDLNSVIMQNPPRGMFMSMTSEIRKNKKNPSTPSGPEII